MTDINTVNLTGRLTSDPILRRGEGNTLVSTFTIACNQRIKDKTGNLQEETAFVTCKAFGNWAEPLASHGKGDLVVVSGRLRTDQWQKDDAMQYQLLLVCERLHFVCLSPESRKGRRQDELAGAPISNAGPAGADSVPF